NPESLDSTIQSCLSALYPPFEATAPTVLSQLFQIIDELYHGDTSLCLTEFLTPARRLLESLQQEACASYSDVVFRYAGWPLCLQDHVVVHLAPVSPLLLCPGDFYLQVAAVGERAAGIVVRSLLDEERRELKDTLILETSFSTVFTQEWLQKLNAGGHGTPLSHCLLATEQGVVKVPWEQVAKPEFVDKPRHMACSGSSNQQESLSRGYDQGSSAPPAYSVETRIRPAKDGIAVSLRLVDNSKFQVQSEMDPSRSGRRPMGWISPSAWESRSKNSFGNDYVNLKDVPKGSTGFSKSWDQPRTPLLRCRKVRNPAPSDPALSSPTTSGPTLSAPAPQDRSTCVRTVRFAEQPCTPCMRRKHGPGTKVQECRYRESHTEAQQGRDRSSRAVVEVYGDEQDWKSLLVSSLELSQLLLYFHTVTKEVRELGLTIVYDARKTPPHSKFTEALQLVEEQNPNAVRCVLMLISKETSNSLEKYSGGMEIVPSLKALHKYVETCQLTPALDGSLSYSHRDWLDLHQSQELHPFVLDLKEATRLLLEAIKKLEGVHKIDSVEDVQQCISEQRALMKEVLEDTRLVNLQREGGAMLARLRWESDVKSAYSEESLVMDTVEDLYNQVEEQVHVLARRSNMSLQHLHFLLQLREMESRFTKIKEWFDVEGERRLLEAEAVEASSGTVQETLQSFTTFLSEANQEQRLQAMTLVTEAESIQGPNYPETEVFHTMVSAFKSSLSDFLSRAEQCCGELEAMVNLCHFCEKATEVAKDCSQHLEQERLQCMTLQEKQMTLQRCHEVMSEFSPECFQEAKAQACSLKMSQAVQVWNVAWVTCQEVSRQLEECLQDLEQADSIYGTVSCFNINFKQSRKGRKGSRETAASDHDPADYAKNAPRKTSQDHRQKSIEGSGTVGCQWFPWQNNSKRNIAEYSSSPKSHTKLQRIMEELLLTELEYVRSLGYILTHYVPLLTRPDVPPDLRGQRGRIFGNLEKLHDFHCRYFLQELESCRGEPLRVGRCFLRHRENFGLYALYSKNKPQSDALVQQHKFFKRKQLELRDSMDLSSYLLKPVQRISKYSLLLQEMVGECGPGQDSERQEIQAAAEVIRFQLRHGNDLLTMDAIRNCDEQGQLIRQDEFYVIFRKKRALRRVFLFQDLILFTKMKKTLRGDEVYVYKQSFKTCDVGLTQSCGQSGLCFEIWFRRRRAQDTYVLQAERQDIKQAWTEDLEQILWEQALKNRLRRQERVFMGVASKAFMDIQPSEGAIQDRAITGFLPGRLVKTPNLLVSSLHKNTALPRPESIVSGSSASTSGSQSSSSSGRGSLSPSAFHGNH
uniref:Si:dkey-65j6.2 n=1 Tax=Astyanax mexicanus TaxID=7994 RepID=W5K0H8_ASTMX